MTAPIDPIRRALAAQAFSIAEFLDIDECFERLASQRIGRVVFSRGALPVVAPARYAVSDGDIYLSTGPDADQHAGISGAVVAFEVDDLDPRNGDGWTVTVTGIAEPCTHPSRWPLVTRLGLAPLDGRWNCVFRLPAGIVSGRQFTAARGLTEGGSP